MALTEIYVDPSIAGDSGTGTIGDPYGDLEYAIEQTTFDTTNGTRINIKAGTDEVLAADLATALQDTSVSVAWVMNATAPLVFQGYTSTAGDGGIGGISGGGGNFPIFGQSLAAHRDVHFIDLHLHNTGTSIILDVDNNAVVVRCELNNSSGGGILAGTFAAILNNYVHNVGGVGIKASGGGGLIAYNRLKNSGANDFTTAIDSTNAICYRNLIDIDGTSDGILASRNSLVINNSIYSNGGSGSGIIGVNAAITTAVLNNLIEGFSATGGFGVEWPGASAGHNYGGNSVYNCATAFGTEAQSSNGAFDGNETLTASPFTSASTGDFSPVNTGSVKEGSLPTAFLEP